MFVGRGDPLRADVGNREARPEASRGVRHYGKPAVYKPAGVL